MLWWWWWCLCLCLCLIAERDELMLHTPRANGQRELNIHSACQFPCGFGLPFSPPQRWPDKLIDTVSGGHIDFIRACKEPLSKVLIFYHIALGILIPITDSAICSTNIYHLRACPDACWRDTSTTRRSRGYGLSSKVPIRHVGNCDIAALITVKCLPGSL